MGMEESKCGYQVSRVIMNSPAHIAGLLPFFDFIVGVDGVPIEEDGPFFKEYLKTHLQQSICMDIYNTRVKNTRRVPITPNEHWGGQGVLGCSITWEDVEKAFQYAWHILEVTPGSNAELACLRYYRDYVIGMEVINASEMYCTMFSDEQDFHRRLSQGTNAANDPQNKRYQNHTVLLLLYDSVENTIRENVVQLPLGCEVGNGLMHTITASKGDPRLPVIAHFFHQQQGNNNNNGLNNTPSFNTNNEIERLSAMPQQLQTTPHQPIESGVYSPSSRGITEQPNNNTNQMMNVEEKTSSSSPLSTVSLDATPSAPAMTTTAPFSYSGNAYLTYTQGEHNQQHSSSHQPSTATSSYQQQVPPLHCSTQAAGYGGVVPIPTTSNHYHYQQPSMGAAPPLHFHYTNQALLPHHQHQQPPVVHNSGCVPATSQPAAY
jgi:hypothetical protein